MSAAKKKPTSLDIVLAIRQRQAESTDFQERVAQQMERGTNRDMYLLLQKVERQTRLPAGICGYPTTMMEGRNKEKNPAWIPTPSGVRRRGQWHTDMLAIATHKRAKKRARVRCAGKATRRRQRAKARS